ncbi:MAG TPA: 30S ribosomal protein S21, partial [Verrucomicrobiales bacterium]|nr:30S ribosomal protein S21 [Verrucomicrobiales bacterium]
MSEVKLKKGEPIDRALRRLKKKVDRENTLREVRNKRHYEKPSERRRRKL